jgi:hypothetical protein
LYMNMMNMIFVCWIKTKQKEHFCENVALYVPKDTGVGARAASCITSQYRKPRQNDSQ